jgi:hypothetical protein
MTPGFIADGLDCNRTVDHTGERFSPKYRRLDLISLHPG